MYIMQSAYYETVNASQAKNKINKYLHQTNIHRTLDSFQWKTRKHY